MESLDGAVHPTTLAPICAAFVTVELNKQRYPLALTKLPKVKCMTVPPVLGPIKGPTELKDKSSKNVNMNPFEVKSTPFIETSSGREPAFVTPGQLQLRAEELMYLAVTMEAPKLHLSSELLKALFATTNTDEPPAREHPMGDALKTDGIA